MIYFAQVSGSGPIKIGYAKRSARIRVAEIQNTCPYQLQILGHMPGTLRDEHTLHKRFSHHRIRGEWYEPTEELLDYISSNATYGPDSETKGYRPFLVALPDDLIECVNETAIETGCTKSHIINESLRKSLKDPIHFEQGQVVISGEIYVRSGYC